MPYSVVERWNYAFPGAFLAELERYLRIPLIIKLIGMKLRNLVLMVLAGSALTACDDPSVGNPDDNQVCLIKSEDLEFTKVSYSYGVNDKLAKLVIVNKNEGTHLSRLYTYEGELLKKVEIFSDSLSINRTLTFDYSYPSSQVVKVLRTPEIISDFNPVYVTTYTLDNELRVILRKDSTSFPSIDGPIYFKGFTKFQYNTDGNLEKVFQVFNPTGNLEEAFQQVGALRELYTGYDDAENIYASIDDVIQLHPNTDLRFCKNNPLQVEFFDGSGKALRKVNYEYLYNSKNQVQQRKSTTTNTNVNIVRIEFFNFSCK